MFKWLLVVMFGMFITTSFSKTVGETKIEKEYTISKAESISIPVTVLTELHFVIPNVRATVPETYQNVEIRKQKVTAKLITFKEPDKVSNIVSNIFYSPRDRI